MSGTTFRKDTFRSRVPDRDCQGRSFSLNPLADRLNAGLVQASKISWSGNLLEGDSGEGTLLEWKAFRRAFPEGAGLQKALQPEVQRAFYRAKRRSA